MNIEVGDRVTYKYKGEDKTFTRILTIDSDIKITLQEDKEILKIERPNWTVVEEKKELLTEAEREFLKQILKYHYVTNILFTNYGIEFFNNCAKTLILKNKHINENLKFDKLVDNRKYTLKELGLEN